MADWFVSSAAYAGYTAFQTSHAYSIGDICIPTAPAAKAKWVYRVTTAGTSSTQPTWPTGANATVTSGTVTFTHVTGQSTYGWTAAAGDIPTILGVVGGIAAAPGDRVFLSSDHAEAQSSTTTYGAAASGWGVIQYICVNRAGSVPPVTADLATGASCASSAALLIDTSCEAYHYGITYSSTANFIYCSNLGQKTGYFKNCQFYLNSATGGNRLCSGTGANAVWDNTTVKFGSTAQYITAVASGPFVLLWLNTPSAIAGATIPTVLFQGYSTAPLFLTARGVDFSAVTGTLVKNSTGSSKYLFDSCKIAPGVIRYDNTSNTTTSEIVELVNCYDGTHYISESYTVAGAVTTEFTITLSGGAADDVGAFAHKMVSTTSTDKLVNPLCGFWIDMEYTSIGSPKTATVEIITSSGALNNDDISLFLQYEGTAGTSVASFASTYPVLLTAASGLTASAASWNSSPSTPAAYHLQIPFTPQVAGRVRAQVRLGKASTTIYYNPQIAIS